MKRMLLVAVALFMVANIASAELYRCEITTRHSAFRHSTEGFNIDTSLSPEKACRDYRSFSLKEYNQCVAETRGNLAKMNSGKADCFLLNRKSVKIGTSACEVLLGKKDNKAYGYSCTGSDADTAMKKLQEMYRY